MTETWKQFEDTIYYVSNWGRVKSLYAGKETIKKPQLNHKGYHIVGIGGNKKMFIHRMVAMCFIGMDPNRPFVNHKNATKTDNHVENLEWCTHTENNNHAAASGLGTPAIPSFVINLKNEFLGEFESQASAMRAFGYKKNVIIISKPDFTPEYRLQMIADRNRPRKQFSMSDRSLNKEQVLFIRKLLLEENHTLAYIGRLFNVDTSIIRGIKLNKIYKDIL